MSLPSGVALRGAIYHLQIKIPLKLREHFPGPFWIRTSLGTGDKRLAGALAHKHWTDALAAFDRAEAKMRPRQFTPLTPAMAAIVVKDAARGLLAFDDASRVDPEGLLLLLRSLEPTPPRFFRAPGAEPLYVDVPEYLKPSSDGSMTPAQLERLQQIQSYTLAEMAKAVSMGRLDAARRSAEASCAAVGVSVDWTLPEHRPLLVTVMRALLGAWIGASDRSRGKLVDTPAPPEDSSDPLASQSPTPKGHRAKTFTDAYEAWKVGKKPDAIKKTTRALAMLKESKQDAPLRSLTRQHALDFRDFINEAMPTAAGKTRSDVLSAIQALLNHAVKEKGWLETNPWDGTAIPKGRAKKRDAWDSDEIAELLKAPLFQAYELDPNPRGGRDAQYWLPLLALLTGERQAELLQLHVTDVYQRDGVWLIDINEDTAEKSVKSAAGARKVAVHAKLAELGFIDYLEDTRRAGHDLLFPHGHTVPSRSASVNYSDFFREQCRALGLYRKLRDFHSFRTTVGTALRAVEPALGEALITAVMGHEAGNVGAANYHRPAPRTIARVIAHLDFPAVMALPRVYPAPPET